VQALGCIGPNSAEDVVEISSLLRDTNRYTRKAAADALGHIGAEATGAVQELVKLLGDSSKYARKAASAALIKIGIKDEDLILFGDMLRNDDKTVCKTALETLAGMKKASFKMLPQIKELLGDSDASVRKLAAETIGSMGLPALFDVITYMRKAEGNARKAAIDAIGFMGEAAQSAAKDLIFLLSDPAVSMRHTAGEALLKILPSSPEMFVEIIKGDDRIARKSAVEILGRMGAPAFDALAGLLKEDNKVWRKAAMQAFLASGDDATAKLVKLLKSKNSSVRKAAAEILSEMDGGDDEE
jgi:HEAT repeat protein